jgi:hypothetical protein
MSTAGIGEHFASDFHGARTKFRQAARKAGALLSEHRLTSHAGPAGELLAMDVALVGDPKVRHLVVLSSGTHGLEGLCGSGAQVALLNDADMLARLTATNAALLLIHAVNPFGFAHSRRVNEDNVDVNRNCIDFSNGLPANAAYEALEDLLIPPTWPPSAENQVAIAAFIGERGIEQYQAAVTLGQYSRPLGMFFGGDKLSWSATVLSGVLSEHGRGRAAVAWIDVHTGLGPRGHAEKIHAGDATEFPASRFIWGADVVPLGDSSSARVTGNVTTLLAQACPESARASVVLEYGTKPLQEVMDAVRADHWIHLRRPDARTTEALKPSIREAFYVDSEDWRGMVVGQARTAVLQAAMGLAA